MSDTVETLPFFLLCFNTDVKRGVIKELIKCNTNIAPFVIAAISVTKKLRIKELFLEIQYTKKSWQNSISKTRFLPIAIYLKCDRVAE